MKKIFSFLLFIIMVTVILYWKRMNMYANYYNEQQTNK